MSGDTYTEDDIARVRETALAMMNKSKLSPFDTKKAIILSDLLFLVAKRALQDEISEKPQKQPTENYKSSTERLVTTVANEFPDVETSEIERAVEILIKTLKPAQEEEAAGAITLEDRASGKLNNLLGAYNEIPISVLIGYLKSRIDTSNNLFPKDNPFS